jgi:hypothetical protein
MDGIMWEELYEDQIRKQNEEKTMKVRVKKEFCVMYNSKVVKIPKDDVMELRRGFISIISSSAKMANILVDTDPVDVTQFIKDNDEFLEIIEDWKPNPHHGDNTLYYGEMKLERPSGLRGWSCFTVMSRDFLSKQEKAFRKLRQIAKHLNGDWKADWSDFNSSKFYLCFEGDKKVLCFKSANIRYNPSAIYFSLINSEIFEKIVLLMNNGDGVCMNDLLED